MRTRLTVSLTRVGCKVCKPRAHSSVSPSPPTRHAPRARLNRDSIRRPHAIRVRRDHQRTRTRTTSPIIVSNNDPTHLYVNQSQLHAYDNNSKMSNYNPHSVIRPMIPLPRRLLAHSINWAHVLHRRRLRLHICRENSKPSSKAYSRRRVMTRHRIIDPRWKKSSSSDSFASRPSLVLHPPPPPRRRRTIPRSLDHLPRLRRILIHHHHRRRRHARN